MRVLMFQPPACDDVAGLLQRPDDSVIGIPLAAVFLQHALPGEARRILGHHTIGFDGEGNGRVDPTIVQRLLVLHPDDVVVRAMPGRRVHETRARILGDVIALKEGNGEVVTERGEGVFTDRTLQAFGVNSSALLIFFNLCRLHYLVGKLVREYELVARLRPIAIRSFGNLIHAICDLGRETDRTVARDRPRSRGPNHHVGT